MARAMEIDSSRINNARQWLEHKWTATIIVFAMSLQVGFHIGWIITKRHESNLRAGDDSPLSECTIHWLGSIAGAVVMGIGLELCGSKDTVSVANLALMIKWSILLYRRDNSLLMLQTLWFADGLSSIMTPFSTSLYLSEIASPNIRGTLISIALTGLPAGATICLAFSSIIPVKVYGYVFIIVGILCTFVLYNLKDTPYIFIRSGKVDEAERSIKSYFYFSDVQEKLREVRGYVLNEKPRSYNLRDLRADYNYACSTNDDDEGKFRPAWTLAGSMYLMILLKFWPRLSGCSLTTFYKLIYNNKEDIFHSHPVESAVGVFVVANVCFFALVDKIDLWGRRRVFLYANLGAFGAEASMGLLFYLSEQNHDLMCYFRWIPLISVPIYVMSYILGFLCVPLVLLGEIFPYRYRSFATFLNCLSVKTSIMIAAYFYRNYVGTSVTNTAYALWIHSAISLFAIPIVIFLMPETRGKTFSQIQVDLESSKRQNVYL